MEPNLLYSSMEASLLGQAFLNENGEFIYVNQSFCESIGYARDYLLTLNLQSLVILGEEEGYEQTGSFLKKGIKGFQIEKMILHGEGYLQSITFTIDDISPDQSLFLVQLDRLSLPAESEDNSPLLASIRGRDEVRLPKKILDGIKDAIITISLDGQFLYVNDEAERMFDLSWEEIQRLDFWTFLQGDKHELSKRIYPLLAGEEYVEVEYFKENKQTWYDVRAYRADDQVTLYFINITNRKQMEQELRDSELRYKSLVEHTPETISVHDGQKLIYINPAGEKLFRAQGQVELIGKRLSELFLLDDAKRIEEEGRLLLDEKNRVLSSIFTLRCLTGQLLEVEATTTLIHFRGKRAFRTILKNISERKHMDDLIRKSDKLSVVAQLAAGVAHEIRNPLTSIKGFLQLFEREKEYNGKYLSLVMEELARVESIIYEYLTLAKPNHDTRFEQVHLDNLAKQVMTLLETQTIMKNVSVELESENIPSVYGSEKQLKQVLINLIRNALDAVEPKGEIKIRLLKHSENKVCIQVEDNGCGISKERMERLGEPFYSTKEKGTGLGLMVCYKILQHHGGAIKVHSEVGTGTRMDVILPVYEASKLTEKVLQ
ncbi:PAS domain S-box protein [Halalkalibacter urbisdiaboli]|uniref:PAS domain S-box protein n=1 Tax=Halalkalibacter urbisdiaboli TaxID=1960589 RepID=UPI000B42ECF0|nr:PAS domain S-box protein [Halalkalibacter urbisdiaboli]